MSNSSHRAAHSSGKPRRKNVVLDLNTARAMLPLVQHIVTEIVDLHQQLDRLMPEQELLDQSRRVLDWRGRQRRYSVQEEINQTEQRMQKAVHELDTLGLNLTDRASGEVDFPTKINGRTASFAWTLGENGLNHWRYGGENLRRPIPDDWESGSPLKVATEH
jgi:hypothetical protein